MKNKKIIIFFYAILFIILLSITSTVNAGLASDARGEAGSRPARAHSDAPSNNPSNGSSSTEIQTDVYEIHEYYNGIVGNVYDYLGYKVNENDVTNPVGGVFVKLMNENGTQVRVTRTNPDGSYSFNNVSPGSYYLEFLYGYLADNTGVNYEDTNNVKQILKYNGQDYIVRAISSPNGVTREQCDVVTQEIRNAGKAATQVYLAVDCSRSSYNTEVTLSDGTKKKRIEIEIEATKKLVDELLSSSQYIYVGVIAFNSEAPRAISLTRDAAAIKAALDFWLNPDYVLCYTNIEKAIDKAYSSFINEDEETNRIILFVSDGIPTQSNDSLIYNDMSDSEINHILKDRIGPATKKKLKEIKTKHNVTIMALMIKTDDEEEREYANSIFIEGESVDFLRTVADGNELANAISEIAKREIFTSIIKSRSSNTTITNVYNIFGAEDRDRRLEIMNNFKNFKYINTSLFKAIDEYENTDEWKEIANKLSENTYGKVKIRGYKMEAGQPNRTYTREVPTGKKDKDGKDITYTQTVHVIWKPKNYENQNIYLQNQTLPSLYMQTTATGLKVRLQQGSLRVNLTQNIGSDVPLYGNVEDQLVYGSTIEVEYEVKIKNLSSITYNQISFLNYLPKGLHYYSTTFDNIRKAGGEVKQIDSNGLYELLNEKSITEETYNTMKDREILLINFGKSENDDYKLVTNDSIDFKITATILISELDDLVNIDFRDNVTEVLSYSNNYARRMIAKKENLNQSVGSAVKLVSLYPGDLASEGENYDIVKTITNDVILTPPTGKEKNYYLLIIGSILVTSLLIVLKLRRKK